ncbi:MAG TPA: hydratase [Tissierellia bacterium]|nr:hydratase [Tissierellia bacterium]
MPDKTFSVKNNVTLAAIQMDVKFGEKDVNISNSLKMIREAAEKGAKLIVLPELCNTGYAFSTSEEAYSLAERVPEGKTVKAWIEIAKELKVYICGGIVELDDDGIRLFNSSVLIGPDGYIGKYRKLHLWNTEKYFFEPGDMGLPVFNTPMGRIGMLICYDMWFPEAFRILALKGADVVCCPVNWVDSRNEEIRKMGTNMAIVNANVNNVFVVAADRFGRERNAYFPGRSIIVDPNGLTCAPVGSHDKEEIVIAEVDLFSSRRLNWSDTNVKIKDRRTDVYELYFK